MTYSAANFYLASSLWLTTSAPWPCGREVFMSTQIAAIVPLNLWLRT
jgi:hypothetical protein